MNFKEEHLREGFSKYHLEGFPFDAVIHRISEADISGLAHDHPFSFHSYIIKGSYIEKVYYINSDGTWGSLKSERKQGTSQHVAAERIHEIISLPEGECWTLITPEPWKQEWGFYQFSKEGILYKKHFEEEFKLYL